MELPIIVQRAIAAKSRLRLDVPRRWVRAAVLLPLFVQDERWHILFTRRTHRVGTHKGQISFPGGKVETDDDSLVETALRETEEEIGVPADSIKVLGRLDDTQSRSARYVVTPYVGTFAGTVAFKPNPSEIDELILVPLRDLQDPAIHRIEWWEYQGTQVPVHFYEWDAYTIWGITGGILADFLDTVPREIFEEQ